MTARKVLVETLAREAEPALRIMASRSVAYLASEQSYRGTSGVAYGLQSPALSTGKLRARSLGTRTTHFGISGDCQGFLTFVEMHSVARSDTRGAWQVTGLGDCLVHAAIGR
jgi:hypothetical protein